MLCSACVSFALAVWSVAGYLILRAAELRAVGSATRLSWPTAALALGSVVCAPFVRETPIAAVACGVTCIGLALAAAADARTGYLFDAITMPTGALVSILAIFGNSILESALGALMLAGTFGAIVVCSRGRMMGLGDVKAAYAIGAAFGPLETPLAILAACVSGLLAAAFAGRLRAGATVSFGPHLAVGSTFALVAGDFIVHRIMGL